MPRIIVIGAGIAGLAAAWRLQQAGHEVEVLERENTPGGRMRSERRGGFIVDRGAQFIASGYDNLLGIAREVGLGQRIRPLARASNAILRDGRLEPGDYDSPIRFARSRLISTTTKLRLPRILFEVWRHRHVLDPMRPELAADIDVDDMPAYLRRVVGEEALEYLFAPAFSSTFDSDPEDLSGAFALLTLSFVLSGFRLLSFDGGTGMLTQTLAEKLTVRPGCEVSDVRVTAAGAIVRCRLPLSGSPPLPELATGERTQIQGSRSPIEKSMAASARDAGGEHTLHADAAVIAVPGPLVPRLCSTLTAAEEAFFEHVRYVRGIIVFLMLPRIPATLPYYGVAFPRREGLELYGMAVDHHKPGAAPAGTGLLNAALTASAAARMWHAGDQAIVQLVLDNLGRTPIGRLEVMDAVVHRWSPMLPQFRAGYLRHLAAFLRRGERSPRLSFAGDYLIGPYTEAALTSGLRAAEETLRQLR
jgi:oxygen-dependent protoporphyrinogen oxidase